MRKQPLTPALKRQRYRTRILAGKTALDREYARAMAQDNPPATREQIGLPEALPGQKNQKP